MSSLVEIKAAIDALPPREYCELMALLHPFDDDAWDRQMQADAAAGKLDAMAQQANADLVAGRCVPIEQVLQDRP